MSGPVFDVDAILFDWGGTLVDVRQEEAAWHRGARDVADWLAREGCPATDVADRLVEQIRKAHERAACDPTHAEVQVRDVFEAWCGACGLDGHLAGRFDDVLAVFGRRWVAALEPMPSARETLKALARRGYRLGLVTNSWAPTSLAREALRCQGLAPLLSVVTISAEVGVRKPARAIFERAHRALDAAGPPIAADRVLFVGDVAAADVAGAGAYGMRTALVVGALNEAPQDQRQRWPADVLIESVADLLAMLPDRATGTARSGGD